MCTFETCFSTGFQPNMESHCHISTVVIAGRGHAVSLLSLFWSHTVCCCVTPSLPIPARSITEAQEVTAASLSTHDRVIRSNDYISAAGGKFIFKNNNVTFLLVVLLPLPNLYLPCLLDHSCRCSMCLLQKLFF